MTREKTSVYGVGYVDLDVENCSQKVNTNQDGWQGKKQVWLENEKGKVLQEKYQVN